MTMAFFRLDRPAWVHGTYYAASAQTPIVIEVPDELKPSRTWEPCDGPATAAAPINLPDAKALSEIQADTAKAKAAAKTGMSAEPKGGAKK